MMDKRIASLMALAALALGAGLAAQTAQESMQSGAAVYTEWMEVMAELTRGVELEEGDMRNFVDHWRDLAELDLVDREEEDASQFKQSLNEALADPIYRSWAAERGLDPEDYLIKSLRLTSLVMLQQAASQEAVAAQQWDDYAAMVEEQCAKVDAQTCQQMRQTMSASKAMGEAMIKAREKLPPPTAREQALMEQYRAEIEAVMMEEGDDYGDYDEE